MIGIREKPEESYSSIFRGCNQLYDIKDGKIYSRVRARNERQQFSFTVISGESELCQIMQEEVELREPAFQGTFYHSSESRRCFGICLPGKQCLLHITYRVHSNPRNTRRSHLRSGVLIHSCFI